jgi:hypothetical protein
LSESKLQQCALTRVEESTASGLAQTHFDIALLGGIVTQETETAAIQAKKSNNQVNNGGVIANVIGRLVKSNTRAAGCQETWSSAHVAAFAASLFELTRHLVQVWFLILFVFTSEGLDDGVFRPSAG